MFYTIPQNHVVLIQRFGKYSRVQKAGLVFKIPFIEGVKRLPEWNGKANKNGYMIELSEQQTDTAPRQCQTLDNVTIEADASIYWKIVDPVKAVYNVDILPKSISDIALNALRANIGKMKLDKVLSQREGLNESIAAQLVELTEKWGIVVTRVEIQEIDYNSETAEAMLQEMTAERKRRAMIAEAKGKAEAEVEQAEAEAKAIRIKAKAQADAVKIAAESESYYLSRLSENVSREVAGKIMISQKYIEGMQVITTNPGDKVFLPGNFDGVLKISE